MNPMIIVWRVTGRCNLGCAFCAYDRHLARPRNDADPMEIRSMGRRLSRWQEHTGRRILVSWLGGEPLLWPPLHGLSVYFRDTLELAVSTTTNGTSLWRPEVQKHLYDKYAELTVSVDGPESVHDGLRGRGGVFAGAKQGIQALAERKLREGGGPLLRANVVLMRHTVAEFPSLCQELADWGIEEISCNQLGGQDRPEFYPPNRILPRQAEVLAAHWEDWRSGLAQRGVRLLGGEGYLRRLVASTLDERLPIGDCGPGRQFLFINEGGLVSPCSFTTAEYGVPLAEVSSLEDLLGLPERFTVARDCGRAAACDDCHSTQVFEKFSSLST